MKKKKPNLFFKLLSILFIVFIGLFIACKSGYYESKVNRNVTLTNDAIKQFEQDILEGKEVDLNSYMNVEVKDYSNTFTKTGEKLSETLGNLFSDGFASAWDIIKVLFL